MTMQTSFRKNLDMTGDDKTMVTMIMIVMIVMVTAIWRWRDSDKLKKKMNDILVGDDDDAADDDHYVDLFLKTAQC